MTKPLLCHIHDLTYWLQLLYVLLLVLQELVGEGKLELLQEMYREWPFFQVTLDMVEMVFAKADPRVSLLYEEHLVSKDLVPFGDNLRRWASGC